MQRMVQIGIVTDTKPHAARVKHLDTGITSDWLQVVQTGADWMPSVNDTVLVLYSPIEGGDGFILGVTT